jgi:undecaprenyl-diphosphatase
MTILHAAILGIIEGITEFLPISSTAHLILAGQLLRLPDTEVLKTFDVVIQSGAILAVLVLYGKRLLVSKDVLLKTLAAFIPTGVIGLALHKVIKGVFFENTYLMLMALLVGGVILIIVDLLHKEERATVQELEAITYKQAIILGFVQAISVIPGVSRSGATIVGGLLMNIRRTVIVEFTFLLAIPTMLAATGYDLLKSASAFSSSDFVNLGVGFVVSFVVALLAIKWLLGYVKKRSFVGFGIYRIALVAMFIGFF